MGAWLWLLVAILLEVGGTTCLKLSYGLTRLAPSIGTVLLYLASFSLLALALKRIDVSVAYAIWSGIGTALIACIGVLYFGEMVSWLKVLSLALIVLGVIGLNLARGTH